MKSVKVFYSYCHIDEPYKKKLETVLSTLRQNNIIEEWHDRKILPGQVLDIEIKYHLEKAELILLLISPDFMNSNYCHNIEMKLALLRRELGLCDVIPIIIRPTDLKGTNLDGLLSLPTDRKPVIHWNKSDLAFDDITEGIRKAVSHLCEKKYSLKSTSERLLKIINSFEKNDGFCKVFLDSLSESSLIYAYENSLLESKLLGEENERDSVKYLKRKYKTFRSYHNNLSAILKNESLNPHRFMDIESYYVETPAYTELCDFFHILDTNAIHETLLLIGEKGSGKTILQNYWLYKNHKRLEQKKIVWVRCDAAKLYHLWDKVINKFNSREDFPELVSIDEYLNMQLLYVFAKYYKEDESFLLKEIFYSIESEDLKFKLPIGRKDPNYTKSAKFTEEIIKISNQIKQYESGVNSGRSLLTDIILSASNDEGLRRQRRQWIALSEAYQGFLQNHSYKLLKIIDGVDNVHMNKPESQNLYCRMIEQVREFVFRKAKVNQIHFAVMRHRTLIDINTHEPLRRDTNDWSELHQIDNTAAPVSQVLKLRLDLLETKLTEEKTKEGELFIKIALEALKQTEQDGHLYHHNNCREYLNNNLTLIAMVYYRVQQLGGEVNAIAPMVAAFRQRNFFLNGKLYLKTKVDWDIYTNEHTGSCLFNIFYFNDEQFLIDGNGPWLCCTRILQVLTKGKTEHDGLVSFLYEQLKYKKYHIESTIINLRAFGLIDSIVLGSGKIGYEISPKGRYVLKMAWTDIDFIYYFSLDALIPESLIEAGFINPHDNKYSHNTHYPFSALTTSVTFLCFLLAISRREIKECVQLSYEDYEKYRIPKISLKLPCEEQENKKLLSASINNYVDRASKQESDDKDKLPRYVFKFWKRYFQNLPI